MSTTEPTQATLVHVDPTTLHLGTNVREANLDKPFIASIRERGVLVPIVATRDENDHLVVQYGQRRTLAAVEVGRDSVPVMVLPDDPAEADRIIDQLGENDHRTALTDTERVAAVEQLALLGLSAGQIAKRTATNKTTVADALRVAESKTARQATQDAGLTLAQAAALTEFEDDAELTDKLIESATYGGFEHAAERARKDRKDAAEVAAATAELTEAGVSVIPEPGYEERTITALRDLRGPETEDGEKTALTAEAHATCEGHAAYVRAGWGDKGATITYVCTSPKKYGHIDRYGRSPAGGPLTEEEKAQRKQVIENNKAWEADLLTAPQELSPEGRDGRLDAVDEIRQAMLDGRGLLPRIGAVRAGTTASLPFVVVDDHEEPIEPFSTFLRDLMLTDMSPLTARSYGNDLLRWWRLLQVLVVEWDHATRAEVEVLVGWMRSADNPQRRRPSATPTPAGPVNQRTGKRVLRPGYAPATINHALSVVSAFYAFHAQFGRGPVINPVPESSAHRARLAHRSPLEPQAQHRRAPLRQKSPELAPRAIPDQLATELLAAMRNSRDRALLALFLSSGARATELLGVTGERVDWTRQQVLVISKGTRALQPVPASPEALRLLTVYFAEHGTPAKEEFIWRTLRGKPGPLSYFAARRVLQRANDMLGTDWTLHDLRHTTIERMTADPDLSLGDVMAVSRHQKIASLDPYLRPRVEQIFDRLQRHYNEPRPEQTLPPGYDVEDFRTVFGG